MILERYHLRPLCLMAINYSLFFVTASVFS